MVMVDERAQPPSAVAGARFDAIFRSTYGGLCGLTYRLLGDRHEAEDVVQEAFVKLSVAPVMDRPEDEVRAWLRRVCLNAGHNRVRDRQRATAREERAGRLADREETSAGPLPAVLRSEEQTAVRRTLAILPDRQRSCLLLRYSGYSYAEIAATLEIAIGSVGVLLARAEKTFRAHYENQESNR